MNDSGYRDPHVGGRQGSREWKTQGDKFLLIIETQSIWSVSEAKDPASRGGDSLSWKCVSRGCKRMVLEIARGIPSLDGSVRQRSLCIS